MFDSPLILDFVLAGHDRRHSGGQPGLPEPEGRKWLLPFQLNAPGGEERKNWPHSGCSCCEAAARSKGRLTAQRPDLDLCLKVEIGRAQTPINKTWSQNTFKNKAQPCCFSLGENSSWATGMSEKETIWCVEMSVSQPERNTVATRTNGLKPQQAEQHCYKLSKKSPSVMWETHKVI